MAEIKPGVAIIIGALLIIYLGGNDGGTTTTTTTTTPSPSVQGCAYAPTFELLAYDKWDSAVDTVANERIIVNGGGPKTYSGSATEAKLGDSVKVLWGYGNASFNKVVESFTINKCGLNTFTNDQMVRNSTAITLQCYNEQNDLIGSSAATSTTNLTIGSGGTETINCEIKGEFERGFVNDLVLIAEMNGSAFKEAETTTTGDLISGETSTPDPYDVTYTAGKTVSWLVEPFETAGTWDFSFYVAAESGINPGTNALAGDRNITLYLYQSDCFENSETHDFECGFENEDSNFPATAVVATEYIWIQ